MTKTLLYNSNPSVNNANWHLIVSNDFTKRSVDYLFQKYRLPSFITPYLIYKGVNLDEFDNFFAPKLKLIRQLVVSEKIWNIGNAVKKLS